MKQSNSGILDTPVGAIRISISYLLISSILNSSGMFACCNGVMTKLHIHVPSVQFKDQYTDP